MHDFDDLLGAEGPLAARIPGFTPRRQQQSLAVAVAQALEGYSTLVAEAGTGTGKTFAYLVPALLSGRRVLISTGTKTLQDQLFHRDLPAVRQALGAPARTALLKGRSNYLCRYRLTAIAEQGLFDSHERVLELQAVRAWAAETRTGDIAELDAVAENSPLWPQVTSTQDNCLGQECPDYGRCLVLEARRAAQEADVVVVNHHLLLADMVLKEDGFGEILPGVDAVIVDEAHQLPEVATQYFGVSVSTRQLSDWVQDVRGEYLLTAADMPELQSSLAACEREIAAVRAGITESAGRMEWSAASDRAGLRTKIEGIEKSIRTLRPALHVLAARSRGLEHCRDRAETLLTGLAAFLDEDDTSPQVRWIEHRGRNLVFNLTPLDAAERFAARMRERPSAWAFLSATLSVGGGFEHFKERLGIAETEELLLGSPFDFEHHALLYLPERMPAPDSPGYTRAVVEAARPVIAASGGRAFMLFTSHRALNEAAEMLEGQFDYPLLVQGAMPRRRLLETFRQKGDAVLLGTASFWEGVDVKGPALSVVIIDKLPFASPGDPVLRARLNLMQSEGRNPFMEYQLPQAAIALKQGVGRLIRDATDQGVMMICDPRLTGKPYGRVFRESLPPMRTTRDLAEVQHFLQTILPVMPEVV